MNRPMYHSNQHKRRKDGQSDGSALLLVLVVVAVLALGTSSYLLMMQNEHRASSYSARRGQASAWAHSGVAYLHAMLALEDVEIDELGGLFDNPEMLQGVVVVDDADPTFEGCFSVLAPAMSQGEYLSTRFGLENESAKLNLNTLVEQTSEQSGGRGASPGSGLSENNSSATGSPAGDVGQTVEAADDQTDEPDDPRERLLLLPGMNEEIADAILDWIDEDDEPRQYGAEKDYYEQLDPPYQPANGPIHSLDELLAVRGVTPLLLYGIDANRNYEVDAAETQRAEEIGFDTTDGLLNRGWSAYLTVVSAERVLDPDGEPKTDINSGDLEDLYDKLTEVLDESQAAAIILLRQYGPMGTQSADGGASQSPGGSTPQTPGGSTPQTPGGSSSGRDGGSSSSSTPPAIAGMSPVGQTAASVPVDASEVELDFEKRASYQLTSLLDLVEAQVQIPGEQGSPTQVVESPWLDQPTTFRGDWLDLEDYFSVGTTRQIAGRINVNRASRAVLETISVLSSSAVEQIVASRSADVDLSTSQQRHAIWLLAEGIVSLEEMKQLEPQITTRGEVYRAQVTGYLGTGRPVARLEVVIDRVDGTPHLIECQDLSPLGPGFTTEQLGIEETDSGVRP